MLRRRESGGIAAGDVSNAAARTARYAGSFVAAVLLVGCVESLPTAPSELTTGVTIYEHANFVGASAHLTQDVSDLKGYAGPCEHELTETTAQNDWNDCVSSVRIAPGWYAVIFTDDDFRGQSLELTADAPNLQLVPGSCSHGGLNDCITSVRVRQR